MTANSEYAESFNPERDEVEDVIELRQQDLRINGAGDAFTLGLWSIFLADRAKVHLVDWEARQIHLSTPSPTLRTKKRF
jgi:hypothetical protein